MSANKLNDPQRSSFCNSKLSAHNIVDKADIILFDNAPASHSGIRVEDY